MGKLLSKHLLSLVALAALSLGSAVSARADIIGATGNNPQPDENVLLNTGLTGNPIFGTTNQTGLSVRFTGQESLTAPANGQARIEATDGTLNFLRVDIPGGSYTSLILNLDAEGDGTVAFRMVDTDGQEFFFNSALGGSGENFFTFTAINGQRIAFIEFVATVPVTAGLDDVAQVRIGGAQLTPTNPVPEPATMLLLGTGLAGVAARVRRRRKGAAAAE
jgi:hypothetical protein